MAKEQKTILKLVADDAIKTIADLKNNIAFYKQSLSEAEIGTQAYQDSLTGLTKTQNMLKDAMYLTNTAGEEQGDVMEGLKLTAEGVGESYNSLVHKMADLKSQLRATDVSTEEGREKFRTLAEQINATNDKLKAMDAAQGNYQRNVGNYKSALEGLAGGFQATAGGAGAVINPLKNMKAGLTAVSATPAVAILGLLANIILKVTKELSSNEESMNRVKVAMSGFSVITDAVTKVIQKLGEGVAWVAEKIGELATKIFGVNEATKERNALANEEIKLQQQQRAHLMENADLELQVSELRAEAAKKDVHSAKERIAMIKEAAELEKKISENAAADAALEYDIIKRRNALTASSTEEKDAEAQAYAKMIQAKTNYFNKSRELNAQIAEATNALAAESAKAAAKMSGDAKALAEDEKQAAKDAEFARREALERQKEADREYTASLRLAMEERRNDTEAYLAGMVQLTQSEYERLRQGEEEADSEFAIRKAQAYNKAQDALTNYLNFEQEQEKLAWENRIAALDEGGVEYYNAQIEYKHWEVEQIELLGRQEAETEEEFQARKLAAEKAYTAAKKQLIQAQISMVSSAASATSSLLGSIADMYEEDEENSEKNAVKIKALRIAAATIDTITGAIAAYMGMCTIPVVGPALGAIQAAAVVAAGIVNIAKIKNTKIGNSDSTSSDASSTLSSATVSAPTYTPEVTQTAVTTGASQEETLNSIASEQRVYILSSDLEADENARKVQVADTSI